VAVSYTHCIFRNMRFALLVLVTILLAAPSGVRAQQVGASYEYSSEMLWGITKATNSGLIGGFMFKYARKLKEDRFHGALVEIVNVKHPAEVRYYSQTGNPFVWGKQHYLYSLRLSYARDIVIFKKASQQGVQVNAFAALGPTLAFEAPYYVEVINGNNTIKVPYDPNLYEYDDIIGTGNILQGIFESSIVPGLNAKAGLSFEFGSFKSNVVGIEVGFQCDFFTREIIIMPTTDNYSRFPSAYFTLYYGSRK
jgi:hypothetical protein